MRADHVQILLGVFNGASTLPEQLDSIRAQSHSDWSLLVSDDGSSDDSSNVISSFAANFPERTVISRKGPGRGFQANYVHLLRQVRDDIPFAAFCDQDDVWFPSKLQTALEALRTVSAGRPAIYCGRTLYCDESMRSLRRSPLFRRPPSFRNALVQSIAGANTFVLNREAIDLLQASVDPGSGIVSHDWWAYQLVSGAGGDVIYDPEPQVRYRLHRRNLVGANDHPLAVLTRIGRVAGGRFREWNEINLALLRANTGLLTQEAQVVLKEFSQIHAEGILDRWRGLSNSGVYRQSRLQSFALFPFATVGRL